MLVNRADRWWPVLAAIAVVIAVSAAPLFWRLGSTPLRMWDESRYANSALEMVESGRLLVTTYDGQPDHWNTKPPLMVWMQALWTVVLGPSELAVRLPSALAGLLTLIVLVGFTGVVLNRPLAGLLAGVTLVVADGFVHLHVTRTGDTDALLVLWTTVYSLAWLLYLVDDGPARQRWLWLTVAGVVLAVMTKGGAGLIALPGLMLFALWEGRLPGLIRSRRFWVACATIAAAVAGWYGLREVLAPGYLDSVGKVEFGGPFLQTSEGHQQSFWFYVDALRQVQFAPFFYALPLVFAWGLASRNATGRATHRLVLCFSLWFLLVISASRTKLYWYDAPLLPLFSLVVGLAMSDLWVLTLGRRLGECRPAARWAVGALVIGLVFGPLYQKVLDEVSRPAEPYAFESEGSFMRVIDAEPDAPRRYTVAMAVAGPAHWAHVKWYIRAFGMRGRAAVALRGDADVVAGDTVLTCQKPLLDAMRGAHQTHELRTWKRCSLIHVDS